MISALKKLTVSKNNIKIDDGNFSRFYKEWKCNSQGEQRIPKFFHGSSNGSTNPLARRVQDLARARRLESNGTDLMDNDELKDFWSLLNVGPEVIDYVTYKQVTSQAGPKCRDLCTAEVFCKLQENGSVFVTELFNYVMRKVWMWQTRKGLFLYEENGFLNEAQMENYILDLVPTLHHLASMEESFLPFYACTAVRKFSFFLDTMKTGKLRTWDVLASGFLDDLLELRDEDLPEEAQQDNWFSAKSALRVYGQFLHLDKDANGMLSRTEMEAYGGGCLTAAFLDRVFQECLTFEGEMDYRTYLDLILALENRHEPQATQYFFRIFDVHGKGYIDTFALNYFYRSMKSKLEERGQESASFDDICDELYDLIRPSDPSGVITLDDLKRSTNHHPSSPGETLVNILVDTLGYWSYENRSLHA